MKFLRRKDVEKKIGLSRAWIYAAMNDGRFPRPIQLGARAIAWPESVVDAWMESRVNATSAGA